MKTPRFILTSSNDDYAPAKRDVLSAHRMRQLWKTRACDEPNPCTCIYTFTICGVWDQHCKVSWRFALFFFQLLTFATL